MSAAEPKGTMTNPLAERDLPYTVPVDGRYWLDAFGRLTELPFSPAGSVLKFDLKAASRKQTDT